MEIGGDVGRGIIDEQALLKLIRGFLFGDEEAFIDGLRKMNITNDFYIKAKESLEGEKRKNRINEVALLASCPNCGYMLILDSFIEVAFSANIGEYRCPNCGALIKYDFVKGSVEGFTTGKSDDSFLGVNLSEVRRNVERRLLSVYSARVLGETNIMVATKVERGKLKLLVRETAHKHSRESWSSEWNWRVELSIDESLQGEAIGMINLSCKWMGAPPQTEIRSPLRVERRFKLEGELARGLSELYSELENEAYEKVVSVLEEAKLAVEWVYPARAVMPPIVSAEEDFVSELKKKIEEKERKKEERI